ncbi:hypothetical protein FOCC_FOCC013611 [Frankliniella occidentalis]|nr:hypothetical protein FOCC_FOCC013611 [Frankliniella occidentalis]
MEVSRRVLYDRLNGVMSCEWSDTLTLFCREHLNIPGSCDDIRRFASRFCDELLTRFVGACSSNRKRFEKRYAAWLGGSASFSPPDPPRESQDSSTVSLSTTTPASTITTRATASQSISSPSCSKSDPCAAQTAILHTQNEIEEDAEVPAQAQVATAEKRKHVSSANSVSTAKRVKLVETEEAASSSQPAPSMALPEKQNVGRPAKYVDECTSKRAKNMKTEDLRLHTPDDALFYAVERVLHSQGKHKSAKAFSLLIKQPDLADRILKEKPTEKTCTPEQALSLLVEMGCSKNDYQTLRNTAVGNSSLLIPPYSTVAAAKLKCYPKNMVFSNQVAEVPLQSLLDHTASRLMEVIEPNVLESLEEGTDIVLFLKYGMDGMGSQSIFKQDSSVGTLEVGEDGQMFLCSLVPLRMKHQS